MSNQADISPPVGTSAAGTSAETVRATTDTGQDVIVVRRRHRRRRRREQYSPIAQRIQMFLLGLIFVLMIVAIAGRSVGKNTSGMIASVHSLYSRSIFSHIHIPLDVAALAIAALILIYLMPGMEDKILKKLGLRKETKSGRSSRSSSSRRR